MTFKQSTFLLAKIHLFTFRSAIAEVRGTIKFPLPFIEVGAQCRKIMNISMHFEGEVEYNFKEKEYKHEIKLPKNMREAFYTTTEAIQYIKTTKEPMRKLDIEADQFGKVKVFAIVGFELQTIRQYLGKQN